MNAKKCDRCKKLYEDYRDKGNRRNAIKVVYRDFNGTIYDDDPCDLCPACMESFKKWLKEGNQNG